jgi:hypothetical protein
MYKVWRRVSSKQNASLKWYRLQCMFDFTKIDGTQQLCQDNLDKDVLQKLDERLSDRRPSASLAESPQILALSTSRCHSPVDLTDNQVLDPSDDEEYRTGRESLVEWLGSLELDPVKPRFVGKSSGFLLVKDAVIRRTALVGEAKTNMLSRFLSSRRDIFWRSAFVSILCLS